MIQPGPEAPGLIKSAQVKVSLAFCIANVPGSLYRTLAPLGARSDVSIIRMESRPLVGTTTSWRKLVQQHRGREDKGIWDLVYYLDFACPGQKVDAVLKQLEDLVLKNKKEHAIQVFGRYLPANTRVDGTKKPWR